MESLLPVASLLPIAAKVLVVLICINAALSGLALALQKIEDATKSAEAGSVLAVVNKISAPLNKIIDFLSANIKH